MQMFQKSLNNGTILLSAVSDERGTLPEDEAEQLANTMRVFVPKGWACAQSHGTSSIEHGEFAGYKQATLVVTPPETCCATQAYKILRAANFKTI